MAIRGIGQPVAAVELQRGLIGVDLHRQLSVTRYHASSPLCARAVEHKGVIVPLGLLLLGMAQPIQPDKALLAQIERPLHRGDGDRQTARVGRQEVVGIDADEVVTHIAIGGLSIEIEVGMAGEADRRSGIRAGDKIHHQIALLQPVLQGYPQIAGKALIPRSGEQCQFDPIRFQLLDLPLLAMKARLPAMQAVRCLIGIQRPALAIA